MAPIVGQKQCFFALQYVAKLRKWRSEWLEFDNLRFKIKTFLGEGAFPENFLGGARPCPPPARLQVLDPPLCEQNWLNHVTWPVHLSSVDYKPLTQRHRRHVIRLALHFLKPQTYTFLRLAIYAVKRNYPGTQVQLPQRYRTSAVITPFN